MVGMEQLFREIDDAASKLVLGQFDAPAYIRRARNVESDLEGLLAQLGTLRRDWLNRPEKLFHEWKSRAGSWDRLAGWLKKPEQISYLRKLDGWLQPALKYPPPPSRWFFGASRAVETLREMIRGFNQAWKTHLESLDLTPLNLARDNYNRWYLLEKECAIGSFHIAGRGFQPLPPVSSRDLLAVLPLLPEDGSEEGHPSD